MLRHEARRHDAGWRAFCRALLYLSHRRYSGTNKRGAAACFHESPPATLPMDSPVLRLSICCRSCHDLASEQRQTARILCRAVLGVVRVAGGIFNLTPRCAHVGHLDRLKEISGRMVRVAGLDERAGSTRRLLKLPTIMRRASPRSWQDVAYSSHLRRTGK